MRSRRAPSSQSPFDARQLKVLHVISTVAPRYGGPSAAVRGMASALTALGADVTVATTDADGSGRLAPAYGQPVIENGTTFRYFRRAAWSRSWHFSWGLTRWLARSIADFDVVEVHALFSYPTIPASRFAARSGVPYVVRPLGTLSQWSLEQRAWKKRPYYALFERSNLERSAAIHVTAESEAVELRALGFDAKVRVIPLGVEVRPVARTRADPSRPLRLLFLSRVHPKKGIELLLSALATLRARGVDGVTLDIAGDGDPEYLRHLNSEAERFGLRECVRFLGAVHGEAKRGAFAASDVFVLTSHNENFGIAAAEALAAGLPVILSHEVGLARDVELNALGITVALDVEAIANAIERMLRDPAGRIAAGERATRYAAEHLSWAECGRRLLSLYQEISSR